MAFYKLENLTFKQISELDKEKTIVVLPTGSMEQHGPHLPLGMDTQTAIFVSESALKKVDDKIDCLLLPSISVGQSPEHMDFSGTLSFSAETYIKMLKEICGNLVHHGFKKILFVNGHGGNISAISSAAFDIREELKLQVFMIHFWSLIPNIPPTILTREAPINIDSHGGELETSMVLYLNPDLVHMDWAVDEDNPKLASGEFVTFGGPVSFAWNSKHDIASSGISGQPSFGSIEKGEIITNYLINIVVKGVEEIASNW